MFSFLNDYLVHQKMWSMSGRRRAKTGNLWTESDFSHLDSQLATVGGNEFAAFCIEQGNCEMTGNVLDKFKEILKRFPPRTRRSMISGCRRSSATNRSQTSAGGRPRTIPIQSINVGVRVSQSTARNLYPEQRPGETKPAREHAIGRFGRNASLARAR